MIVPIHGFVPVGGGSVADHRFDLASLISRTKADCSLGSAEGLQRRRELEELQLFIYTAQRHELEALRHGVLRPFLS